VVVICRGGMDGLSVAPPVGDSDYQRPARRLALGDTALKLDGTFGLNPALPRIHALAQAGQARIAPAVATPDRARSHFEAQDVLETGAGGVYATTSGWLKPHGPGHVGPGQGRGHLRRPHRAPDPARPGRRRLLVAGRSVDARRALPTLLQDLYKDDAAAGPGAGPRPADRDHGQASGAATAAGDMAGQRPRGGQAAEPRGRPRHGRLAGRLPEGARRAAAGGGLPRTASTPTPTRRACWAVRLASLDALVDGLHTGLGPGLEGHRRPGGHRVRPHRARQRHRRHRPRHGSTALVMGGGLKSGRHRRRLADPEAHRPVRGPRRLSGAGPAAASQGLLADHLGVDRRA
jgi:hypothetical protein